MGLIPLRLISSLLSTPAAIGALIYRNVATCRAKPRCLPFVGPESSLANGE